jgi:hypothetical protein
MFHPVGSLPPSVYWRRRLSLLAALVVLIAITIYVLKPGGKNEPIRATAADRATQQATQPTQPTQPAPTTSAAPLTSSSGGIDATSTRAAQGSSSSAVPQPCPLDKLDVKAVVGGSGSFKVGDQPVLMLQVTNSSGKACVQDLADSQVELKVYNGESRVWGSHDCQVQPGTSPNTLTAGQSVRVSITWSGLSSQPQCAGTRQRVGAGTYTLYATLSGKQGTAATFSIS